MHHEEFIAKINKFLVKSGITDETANSFYEGCEIIYRRSKGNVKLLISFFDKMDLTVDNYNEIIRFCSSLEMKEDDIIVIYDKIKDSVGDNYRNLVPCIRRFPRAILHAVSTLTNQRHVEVWNNDFSCTIGEESNITIDQFLTKLSQYCDTQTTGNMMLKQLCCGKYNNLYDRYVTEYTEYVLMTALEHGNEHIISDQIIRAFQHDPNRHDLSHDDPNRYGRIYSIHRCIEQHFNQIMKHFHRLFNVNTYNDFIHAKPRGEHEIDLNIGPLFQTMIEIIKHDTNGQYISVIRDIIDAIRENSSEFIGQWKELIEKLESWNKLYHGKL